MKLSKETLKKTTDYRDIKSSITPPFDHLAHFLSIEENTKWIGGVNSYDWCKYVLNDESSINYNLNQKFYRDDLLAYCNDIDNSDLNALLAILSWGGMHREHGRKLLAKPDTVLDIVNKLRTGYFSTRKEAFSYIKNQRSNKLLPGLGIGYYTKLICFLAPDLNGYIMDQWLAKSINLIANNKKIKIEGSGWVNDDNNEDIYEYFCQEVDKIACELEISGFKAEERLFSIGGRKKGIWRQYILDNYK